MNIKAITPLSSPHTDCLQCPVRERSLFKDLNKKTLTVPQEARHNQVLIPARSRIFQEGEAHDSVYTLFNGWGILYKTVSNNGKRQILRFLLPGDLIAYQTDANGLMAYSAGTITESILCAFDRKKLTSSIQSSPEIALRLLNMEARNISLCQSHLMAAGRKTAKESIAFILLELYHRAQLQDKNSYTDKTHSIDFPITQEDLGDAVGLTNVHVNRVMKELISEKLITCHKKKLTIIEEEKLCKIAEFSPEMINIQTFS